MDTPPVLRAQAPTSSRSTRQAPHMTSASRQSPGPSGGGHGHRSGSRAGRSSSPMPHPHAQPHHSPDIVHLGGSSKSRKQDSYVSGSDDDEDDTTFVPIPKRSKQPESKSKGKHDSRSLKSKQDNRIKEEVKPKPEVKSRQKKKEEEPLAPFEWNATAQAKLYRVLLVNGFRPVGINKHFQMMVAHNDFCKAMNETVDVRHLWEHIGCLYDLNALEKLEVEHEFKVNDFCLSDFEDLGEYIKEREKMEIVPDEEENDNNNDDPSSTDEDLPDLPVSELPVLAAEPFKLMPKKSRHH